MIRNLHLTNKMFYAFCIFNIVVFGFSAAEQVPLPSMTICKRNSVNYSDCLKDSIQAAWPQFVKGLPEFDFPSLDPINYEFGNGVFDRAPIHGNINVSNFIVEGFEKTRFLGGKSYFDDNIFRLEINIQIPKIVGSGECDAIGSIGEFKMGGKGYLNLTAEDLQGSWILTGPVVNDIWTVEHFHAAPSIRKLKVYFKDLFNGNKELNDLALYFVNEYWPTFYRIVMQVGSDAWSPWLCDIANKFFLKVSFKQIFP